MCVDWDAGGPMGVFWRAVEGLWGSTGMLWPMEVDWGALRVLWGLTGVFCGVLCGPGPSRDPTGVAFDTFGLRDHLGAPNTYARTKYMCLNVRLDPLKCGSL